jgi:hypothetical protein
MGAGSTCVNTQTDNNNCGGCGIVCPPGRMCAMNMCQASCGGTTPDRCGMGAMSFCTNLQTDNNNCGACGNVCGANARCMAGTCRPTNDTMGTAVVLPYEHNNRRTVTGSTVGAMNDTGACAGSNNTVYYRIDVIARSIVYVETFGSTTNTVVGFRPLGAATSSSCNDNACGTMQSQAAIVADVGALYIEVGNAAGGAGPFTLRYTIQPAGAGDVTAITPSATTQTVVGSTNATNGVAQSCGSMTSAGEDAFYFMTCPTDPARRLHVSTCGSYFDTVVELRSVGVPAVCNDDAGNGECPITGGTQAGSNIVPNLPAGSGLHVFYVDGYSSGSYGRYVLQYSLAACNDGYTFCGGTCVLTSSFDSNNANCGACGNACPAGQTCSNSACGPVPQNTFPAVQYPVQVTVMAGAGGGTMFNDDCPVGQVLVGVHVTNDPTTGQLRSIRGVCGIARLGGAPARMSFPTAGAVMLPVRGTATGGVNVRHCPLGYALTAFSGRASATALESLTLQCSRVNVTGTGPYTVTIPVASSNAVPVGGTGGIAFGSVACPANHVAMGLSSRTGAAVNALGLRCERLRTFRATVNNAATGMLPYQGVANASSMTFSDNCPAGQIVAGVTARSTATGLHQLAVVCRPYNGLAGTGDWLYTSGADTALALRGTAVAGDMTQNAICPNGAAPMRLFTQNNATNTYLSTITMTCQRLGTDTTGTATYTTTGITGTVGTGSGTFVSNNCAMGSLVTGMDIRASTDGIQQIALRCTPVSSL